MKLDISSVQNKYKLASKEHDLIVYVIQTYLNRIGKLNSRIVSESIELISIFGIISEFINVIHDYEQWLHEANVILNIINENIKQRKWNSISLHEGLTNIGVYNYSLSKKSNDFIKSGCDINDILCKAVNWQCLKIKEDNCIKTYNFDVIDGLSGVGFYLLQFIGNKRVCIALQLICTYLVKLSQYKIINGIKIPGWFIDLRHEPKYEQYSRFTGGYINYSLSHGIGGPLIFLTEALEKGICVNGQKAAIELIIEEYLYVNKESQGRWWSGIISRADYENRIFPDRADRQSWCYGSLSVLVALYKAAKYLKMEHLKHRIITELKAMANITNKRLQLNSPIICHGYAGTMTIFRWLYDDTGIVEFLRAAKHQLYYTLQFFDEKSFLCFRGIKNSYRRSEPDNSFLCGASGVIMGLAAWIKEDCGFETMLLLKNS